MIKQSVINEEIKAVLTLIDSEKYQEVMDFLECQLSDEDLFVDGVDLATEIRCFHHLPQEIWDYVIHLLELEVDAGNDAAMNDLGAMYYDGTGCEQSFAKAVKYYQMAAELGNRQAQENLGYCYYYGRNVPVDYEKAFQYFALGAFDGHLISLYKIGDMYANGYYVEKNEKEAFNIYMHCIETMTEEAEGIVAGPVFLRLGDFFFYGKGVEKSLENAIISYQRAEVFLYKMVKNGEIMYKKSLKRAIEGQDKVRKVMLENLSDEEWIFE